MVSSGTDKSNEVIMEINQALKQHLRIFQFSENILAVVFLRIIKFYLFQVFKERNYPRHVACQRSGGMKAVDHVGLPDDGKYQLQGFH